MKPLKDWVEKPFAVVGIEYKWNAIKSYAIAMQARIIDASEDLQRDILETCEKAQILHGDVGHETWWEAVAERPEIATMSPPCWSFSGAGSSRLRKGCCNKVGNGHD